MSTMVSGENLTKAYQIGSGQILVMDGVNLDIGRGEMVAILGEPGVGKSTLLHTIGCLLKPDSGQVSIDDVKVTLLDDKEIAQFRTQKVGFLFQAFNLLPDETALDNVALPLLAKGFGAKYIGQLAGRALELVGLADKMDWKSNRLSASERQCVALARTLVGRPSVIFADEPAAGLDGPSKEVVLGILQKLNKAGMTIVIATADSSLAHSCHRVLRLFDGKIIDEGPGTGRRALIPPGHTSNAFAEVSASTQLVVCVRCNFTNPNKEVKCKRCSFPLNLTDEEKNSVRSRLRGDDDRYLGVESADDEGQVLGEELIEELNEIPVFAALGRKNIAKVLPLLKSVRFSKGSVIIRQDDQGETFYAIRAGNVDVVVERGNNIPPILLASLGPNENFWEMALLNDGPRSASVVAKTDVEVWSMSKAGFQSLLSGNLSLAVYFNRLAEYRRKMLRQTAAQL